MSPLRFPHVTCCTRRWWHIGDPDRHTSPPWRLHSGLCRWTINKQNMTEETRWFRIVRMASRTIRLKDARASLRPALCPRRGNPSTESLTWEGVWIWRSSEVVSEVESSAQATGRGASRVLQSPNGTGFYCKCNRHRLQGFKQSWHDLIYVLRLSM